MTTTQASSSDMRVVEIMLAAIDMDKYGRRAFVKLVRPFLADMPADIQWGKQVSFAGQKYILPSRKAFQTAMGKLLEPKA